MTEAQRALERHAQTILVLILVALLLWVGGTTQQTAVKVAAMSVQVASLKQRVDLSPNEFQRIERRLDGIEGTLNTISTEHLEFRRRMQEEKQ